MGSLHVYMKCVLGFEHRLAHPATVISRIVVIFNVIDNVVLSGTDLSAHDALEHVLLQALDARRYVFPIP